MSSDSNLNREILLRDADNAMYQAKQNGKARYEIFDQHMKARADWRLKLENDLPVICCETSGAIKLRGNCC